MAPLEYVHILHLEEAKQMLESTEQPIEAIANEVGYEDAGSFNRPFRRSVNMKLTRLFKNLYYSAAVSLRHARDAAEIEAQVQAHRASS